MRTTNERLVAREIENVTVLSEIEPFVAAQKTERPLFRVHLATGEEFLGRNSKLRGVF